MSDSRSTTISANAEALAASRVPSLYHRPDATFAAFKTPNATGWMQWFADKSAAAWATGGGLVHIAYDSAPALHEVNLAARGLVMKGHPVIVLPLVTLAAAIEEKTQGELLEDRRVLLIPGFVATHYRQPLPENTVVRLEWLVRRWLLAGNALLTQGDKSLRECKWWPPSFITFLDAYLKKEWTL